MKAFHQLTPAGRTRRLRRLALNALAQYDLETARVDLITNDTNAVYRVTTRAGERWVLRVTAPEGGHSADHLTAEMDWLLALARDTNLRVPHPLAARSGERVLRAAAPGVPEERFCAVFSWLPGTNLAAQLSQPNVARLGELSACLHEHARGYLPPAGLDLLVFDRPLPFPEPVILFEPAAAGLFSDQQQALFAHWYARIQAVLARLAAGGDAPRILHGDLHPWNVRIQAGVLAPFDFEDLMWGWPVQDIATSLYYFIDRPDFAQLRAAFETGYRRTAGWPERAEGEINTFIAARGIGLLNLVLHFGELWQIAPQEFATRIEKRLLKLSG